MALAIAMLMGDVDGGLQRLLTKQLMLRRLGAAESKQLAEMAATSGMNRLLASMNTVDTSEAGVDLTYPVELNQNANFSNSDPSQQQWDLPVRASAPSSTSLDPLPQEPSSAELGLFEGELQEAPTCVMTAAPVPFKPATGCVPTAMAAPAAPLKSRATPPKPAVIRS